MIYLIQVTMYAAILYMVYLLFLKNKTDHNWSRAYLLVNMVLPFALPFISLSIFEQNSDAVAAVILPVVTIGAEVSEKASAISVLPIIYIAISCTLLGYLIAQAVQITLFLKRHESEKLGNIRLIRNTSMGPGSWFSYVFIPKEDADEAVLQHERAHVRFGHSYDIVLMRLIQCFAWPNILIWVIAKELKTVHEFQADAVAGNNKATYGETLLNELFHTKHFSLSHTFFHHPIKRRIMMLQKNKSHAGKMKVITLSLLMVTGMIFVQCSKDTAPQTATISLPEQTKDKNGVYNMVDKMPEFNGDLMKYMVNNIKYPESAKTKKIEGRVVVKFVVDEKGNVAKAEVLKSPDQTLSDAALAVVNTMPKWIPGENKGKKVKVYFTLPISYRLETPEPTEFKKLLDKSGYNTNGKLKLFPDEVQKEAGIIIPAFGC
jgi:TonB family protein